jgi:hypothetical protein
MPAMKSKQMPYIIRYTSKTPRRYGKSAYRC